MSTSYIPQPERPIDQPFLMPVEDVFSISGRGTVVTGRVERGVIKVGEEIEIVGLRDTQKTIVTGVEMFRKLLDQGQAGDNIGALLRGTKREEVERGQVLCKPGSVKPHTKFKAEAYILTKEEGGRHTPFFTNYRPQFYFRTTDVTGVVHLPEGTEMVMPGDNIAMEVHLIVPIAMEEKLRFAIREGGRTVGAGVAQRAARIRVRIQDRRRSVPKEYIPGVEKGLNSVLSSGVVAGFPVVDVKVQLVDGAYHDVDSSALAFEIASRAAFREALQKGKSVLLEPIMKVEVVTPEDYTGSVIGDLNSRRGQIQGQDMRGNANVINAMVPLMNMFGYVNNLRSMSQGRATFTMQFDHYAEAPANVSAEVQKKFA